MQHYWPVRTSWSSSFRILCLACWVLGGSVHAWTTTEVSSTSFNTRIPSWTTLEFKPSVCLTTTCIWMAADTPDSTVPSKPRPAEWQGVVLSQLKQIMDPDLGIDIVTAGFIQQLHCTDDNVVSFTVELTTPACPVKEQFQADCQRLVQELPWVGDVHVTMSSASPMSSSSSSALWSGLSQVQNIIAVSSCKGGVGKSTTAVQLAFSLQQLGATVGILDADLYGPSLPTLVTPDDDVVRFVGRQVAPLQRNGVRLFSFGHINENAAVMRGAMVTQVLEQFLSVCQWGPLDYLVLDLPPGTGDIPLTLTQQLNITAAVIVTTPTELSFTDVIKGMDMFDTVQVPCVAVVENMAYYRHEPSLELQQSVATAVRQYKQPQNQAESSRTEDAKDDDWTDQDEALVQSLLETVRREEIPIFGSLGPIHQERLKNQWGMEHAFRVPLETNLATQGDAGTPFVVQYPHSETARIYKKLAETVVQEVSKLNFQSAQNAKSVLTHQTRSEGDDSQQHTLTLKGQSVSAVTLRRACRCAACVEEMTGRQLLQPSDVSETIAPLKIQSVGNYAWSIDWSDGHSSLYPERSIVQLMNDQKEQQEEQSSEDEDSSTETLSSGKPTAAKANRQAGEAVSR